MARRLTRFGRFRRRWRERIRAWRKDWRRHWPIYTFILGYCAVLLLVAINPLVDPLMPNGRGRGAVLAAIPLSHHLLDGGPYEMALFVLVWAPFAAILAMLIALPWLRTRQKLRQAERRRVRDRERRARLRAERQAASTLAIAAENGEYRQ